MGHSTLIYYLFQIFWNKNDHVFVTLILFLRLSIAGAWWLLFAVAMQSPKTTNIKSQADELFTQK